MYPKYIRPVRQREAVCFFRVAARETLVGGADQDRTAETPQPLQLLQDLPVLLRALGEAQARVQDPFRNPVFLRLEGKVLEIALQFRHDPGGIVGLRIHRAGVPPLVHRHIGKAQPSDGGEHIRVVLPR